MLVRDLLKSALKLSGAISNTETPSADDLATAQDVFSNILSMWSTNPSLLWTKDVTQYVITPDINNISIVRPSRILSANFCYNSNQNKNVIYPMEQLDTVDFYELSNKNVGGVPKYYTWDGAQSVKFTGNVTGYITLVTQPNITDYSSNLDTNLSLPTGYEAALKYNIALMLSEEFGKSPTPLITQLAVDSFNAIKSQNKRPAISRPEISQAFNNTNSYYNNNIVR